MKIILSVVFIIFSAVIAHADEYYESNILGMKLKEISSPYDSETGWVLTIVKSEGGGETRYLDRDNERVSTKEISIDGKDVTEITTEKGRVLKVKRTDGIILSEQSEKDDGSSELLEYSYEGRILKSTDVTIDKVKAYTDNYYYTNSGRLLDVQRDYYNSPDDSSISFVFDDGRISSFWLTSKDRSNYLRFDSGGLILSETFGDDYNETREYKRAADGTKVEIITDGSSEIETRLYYDSENRLRRSRRTDGGTLVEESGWLYRGGKLVEFRTRRALLLDVFSYEWSADGELLKEKYTRNGIIIQLTEYQSEADFTETLYRNGRAVLKINYAGGIRIDTVQLQD